MRFILAACFGLLVIFSFVGTAYALDVNEIYNNQYHDSNADELGDALPNEVVENIKGFDFSIDDFSSIKNISTKNIFTQIFSFLKDGGKRPFVAGGAILGILLLSSVVGDIFSENRMVQFVATLSLSAVAIMPVVTVITETVSAISAAGVFMLGFVPVFASVLIARGKTLTASGFSAVILAAAEGVSSLCSFVIVPLTGMQLGLAVCGSTVPEFNSSSFVRVLSRISKWALTLATTVMLAVLGAQTLINGSADSVSAKTLKFIVGTTVPVIGNAVSEALMTVKGCVKLLGSSVAVYGILAVALIFLPLVIELLLWRIVLLVTASVGEMLSNNQAANLLRSVDSAVSVVLGVMIFVGLLFIIAITTVSIV